MNEANSTIRRAKSGQAGFYVSESLMTVYCEIAGLLGIPFNNCTDLNIMEKAPLKRALLPQIGTNPDIGGYHVIVEEEVIAEEEVIKGYPELRSLSNYEVIIVDGISLTSLERIISKTSESGQPNPLILVCGPVSGESPGLRLKTFSFNLGQEGTRLLMNGREYTEKQAGEPALDLMLEEIRAVLRREIRNFIELPPIPWGYTYAMTLTHDIDILSLKEMPVARTFLGYFYRSSVLNWKRWRAGKVRTSEFCRAIWEMAGTGAAKLGLGQDVWQRALPALLELEKRLDVRSSLYFMPFPKKPGVNAPANRASFYDIANYKDLLNSLETGGWEAGVHGIDAWHDPEAAQAEYGRIAHLTGQDEIGVRMHWLYFQSPDSFRSLEEGGFGYDATFGYNEIAGFRAGTLQPYHPLNCQKLWELPLHIQDGALLGEEHLDLNREDAFQRAKPILEWAKRLGGAVSLLWHNQSFTAPRFWGEVYERLITQGREDGAWIAIPREVLRWFTLRRQCQADLSIDGTRWQITFSPDLSAQCLPPVRIRLHLDPTRVRAASVPYEAGEGYLDFPARALITLDVEEEG